VLENTLSSWINMKHTTLRSRSSKISDYEPRWKADDGDSQLAQMLTWYGYNKTSEDAKKYFIEFLKNEGESADVLNKIAKTDNIPFTNTIGWLCRIKIINGDLVPSKYDKHIEETKNKIKSVFAEKVVDNPQVETVSANKPSVQDHLQNQLREFLGEIDEKIDQFLVSKCKKTFDVYEWLKTKNIKHTQANNIGKYFSDIVLPELQEAISGECEQLKEGYSFLSKKQLKEYAQFIEQIVSDTARWCDVAKQISLNNRAPRAKKPKPAIKQIAKLNFLREYENLKSIPPTQIVGSTQLWIYNTKYKTLGVYVCNNAHGFSVKGSTILNFDAAESIAKKLRKPEEIIPKVLEAGKVALRKILPGIRAKDKKLTGRINRDTILLKAL